MALLRIKEDLAAIVLFVAFFGTILLGAGIAGSGFHFRDDHKMISNVSAIEDSSFGDVLAENIKGDLRTRFKPLFVAYYVLQAGVFSDNFKAWYIASGFLGVITALFFYLFARNTGFSFGNSVFFSFFTLVGQQTLTWWQLCTAEPLGMFFLSVAFFLMAKSNKNPGNVLLTVGFMAAVICASLCKESFIIIVPAIMLMRIYLFGAFEKISFFRALSKKGLSTLVVLAVVFLELYLIVVVIGTAKEGFNGIDAEMPLLGLLNDPVKVIRDMRLDIWAMLDLATLCVIFLGCFLAVEKVAAGINKNNGQILARIVKAGKLVLLFLLMIAPQLILYNKCGIYARYWLPGVLAFSLALLYVSGKVLVSRDLETFSKRVFVSLLVLVMLPKFGHSIARAKDLADEGFATNKFLSGIVNATDKDSKILIVADPVIDSEWSTSILTYLDIKAGRKNCFYKWIKTGRISHSEKFSQKLLSQNEEAFSDRIVTADSEDFACIAVFSGLSGQLENDPGFSDMNDRYTKNVFKWGRGDLVLYVKK